MRRPYSINLLIAIYYLFITVIDVELYNFIILRYCSGSPAA
jgi:hypothetical protein